MPFATFLSTSFKKDDEAHWDWDDEAHWDWDDEVALDDGDGSVDLI